MFNLSGSEIVVILLLALVVLGPEKLPDAIRKFGRTYAELKKMGTGFQQEFKSAIDEPMREMRETADLLKRSADFTTNVKPQTSAPQTSAPQTSSNDATPAPEDDPVTDGPAPNDSVASADDDAVPATDERFDNGDAVPAVDVQSDGPRDESDDRGEADDG